MRSFAVSVFALALYLFAPGSFLAGAQYTPDKSAASSDNSRATSSTKASNSASNSAKNHSSPPKSRQKKTASQQSGTHRAAGKTAVAKKHRKPVSPRVRRARAAFVASANLRAMAQQLLQDRTPTAYAGVEAYARRHAKEDAGALAWLVVGYAHTLDHDYAKSHRAAQSGPKLEPGELGDYVTYYLGDAYLKTGHNAEALATLAEFGKTYPDSLLIRDAHFDYASVLFDEGRAQEAYLRTLLDKRTVCRCAATSRPRSRTRL